MTSGHAVPATGEVGPQSIGVQWVVIQGENHGPLYGV
jgi:hypothetical protein